MNTVIQAEKLLGQLAITQNWIQCCFSLPEPMECGNPLIPALSKYALSLMECTMKMQLGMQRIWIYKFHKTCKANFEKAVFRKRVVSGIKRDTTPTYVYDNISGTSMSFTQKFSCISKLLTGFKFQVHTKRMGQGPATPHFQKYYFFKHDPKNLTKVENFKSLFASLVTIL